MKKFSNIVRNAGQSIFRSARKFWRNNLALLKRIQLAWNHGNEDEIINALITLMEEGIRCLLIVAFYACLVAGFFKPHCFITALFYIILIAVWNSNIKDRREQGRA